MRETKRKEERPRNGIRWLTSGHEAFVLFLFLFSESEHIILLICECVVDPRISVSSTIYDRLIDELSDVNCSMIWQKNDIILECDSLFIVNYVTWNAELPIFNFNPVMSFGSFYIQSRLFIAQKIVPLKKDTNELLIYVILHFNFILNISEWEFRENENSRIVVG